VYSFDWGAELDSLESFYRPRVQAGEIGFPDLYVVLQTSIEELWRRKEVDETRKRKNFEKHLLIIEPQRRHFEAVNQFSAGRVVFLDSESTEKNVESILSLDHSLLKTQENNHRDIFDQIIQWLRENEA